MAESGRDWGKDEQPSTLAPGRNDQFKANTYFRLFFSGRLNIHPLSEWIADWTGDVSGYLR